VAYTPCCRPSKTPYPIAYASSRASHVREDFMLEDSPSP
jgi:hypothetical protein